MGFFQWMMDSGCMHLVGLGWVGFSLLDDISSGTNPSSLGKRKKKKEKKKKQQ